MLLQLAQNRTGMVRLFLEKIQGRIAGRSQRVRRVVRPNGICREKYDETMESK